MTKQKTIADIKTRAAELGLKDEIRQLSEVDDEQRRQIGVLTDEILYLHSKIQELLNEIMLERLDRIQERQKTMKEKEYEFQEFWRNHYGIDIDALDDEVYMEMINYLNSIAKYQKGE